MFELSRNDLVQRLQDFDEEIYLLYGENFHFDIVIVGGGALLLMNLTDRVTHDIDVISSVPDKLQKYMAAYDINTRVAAYSFNFPFNYPDRKKKLDLTGKCLDFYTVSLEDIVISKLYACRDSDMLDITAPAVLKDINWDLLHKLATAEDEAKASALNERNYLEFKARFDEYEGRYRPCEN